MRVDDSGCLDQCGHGHNLFIYPENVRDAHVTRQEAEIIFARHTLGGRPVERLRFQPPNPGDTRWPEPRTENLRAVYPLSRRTGDHLRRRKCTEPGSRKGGA